MRAVWRPRNPYRHPNRLVRAGAYAATALGGFRGARQIMGPYAPTMRDVNTIYKAGKSAFKSKSSYGPRGRRYVKSKFKSFPKKVSRQIKQLKRIAESDMGTLVFRDREFNALASPVKQQNVTVKDGITIPALEEVIAQLRYYDPTAPTALVTASGTDGTYQKEFFFQRALTKLTIHNNYQVPCHVSVYVCQCKGDTNLSPQTTWSNGLTDSSNGAITNINSYPTDSEQFTDLWRIVKSKKTKLMPGRSFVMSHALKPFQYDPSLFDSHGLNNMTKYKNFSYLIIVRGPTGHDSSVLTEHGVLPASIDIELDRVFEVKYAAGADIKFTYVVDNAANTFTNAGVISNKPANAQQSHSV